MSRYASASQFSLSHEDFEREPVLKRRRQLSPPRAKKTNTVNTNGANTNSSSSAAATRTRSKSKSRARESSLRRLPSVQGQDLIPLGRGSNNSNRNNKINKDNRSNRNRRSPSASRGRRRERSPPSPREHDHYMRTRSQSTARSALRADAKEPRRSKSKSRKRTASSSRSRSRSRSSSRSYSQSPKTNKSKLKRQRSKSVARDSSTNKTKASSSRSRPTPTVGKSSSTSRTTTDQELQRDMDREEKKLKKAKSELADLEDALATLQKRVDAKKYEVLDLQIVIDGLYKRRELQQQFLANTSSRTRRNASPEVSQRSSRNGTQRRSKRPCIEDDEEDEEEEDEVEIIEAPPSPRVKEEDRRESHASSKPRSSSSKPTSSSSSTHTSDAKATASVAKPVASPPIVDQMSDYFWGRVDIAKLLVQPRIANIPDGSARKGRHLAFNPVQQDVFAVSSDDGGLLLWNYARQTQAVTKVVSISPSSFRKENQCAESMAWSPDGYRLALAFRDPVASMGEFCVVRLHELPYVTPVPQVLPRERVKSKSTTLHARGISVIDWVPGGYGDRQGARGLVTAGADHAVVLWEEREGQSDYKWRVLHREHRSDVRAICMHSQGHALYTGALDGMVVRYDLHSQRTVTILERRRPQISKINAVLENPHNPNLLLVSSVEQSEHNFVLHDLREKYDHARPRTMTLSYQRASDAKSMSQYIVPRWSPGGFHVSCGSTSGIVNIWDVRVRGPKFPVVLPQQSIQVHQKQVLHATWHPRYDAMFSVSHDRTLGLLTFR